MKKRLLFLTLTAILICNLLYAGNQPDEAKDYGRASYQPAEGQQEEVHGTDALEMISQRMKELTGSLAAMPDIPQLNQTIMLPGIDPNYTENKKDLEKKENASEPQQEGAKK